LDSNEGGVIYVFPKNDPRNCLSPPPPRVVEDEDEDDGVDDEGVSD